MPDKFKEVVIVIVASIIIFLVFTGIVVFIIMFYQHKKHQHKQKLNEIEKTYTETLLTTRLEIQEETFKTISQEIHDNIGQALIFVKLTINTVDVYNPAAAKEKLLESKNQLSQTIQDLRDLAKSLNPDFITELGLPGAIEQQLQFLQKTGEYQATLTINGQQYKSPQQQELVMFRIVQELLNNIVKHAAATEVEVLMDYQPEKLVITVKDNGCGFDIPEQSSAQKGLGLPNMLNRMALIKGSIVINSAPGMGTEAIIELPKVTPTSP